MSFSYSKCNIFVGIDQSLNSTGYYILGLDEEIKGLIKPGKRRGAARLSYIFDSIEAILVGHVSDQVLVCMEGYAYDYRQGKIFELGECGGVVKMSCYRMGIRCLSVPPTELKKFVTGKGSASKEGMMEATGEKQNDIADAKGLAWIAQEICLKETTERKKLEVIKNCLKNNREEVDKKKYKRKSSSQTAPEVRL